MFRLRSQLPPTILFQESSHLKSKLKYYEGLIKDFESDLEASEYNNQKLQEKIKDLLSSHHDLEIISNDLKADKVRDDLTIKALRRLTKNVCNMYEESQLKIKSQQEEIIQLAKANQQLCEANETSVHDEIDSLENTCTESSEVIQPTKPVSESPTNSYVFPPTPDNVIPPVFTPFSVHAEPSTLKSHLPCDKEAPVSTGQLCESENHPVSFSPLKLEVTKSNEQRSEERDKPPTVDLKTASAVQTTEAVPEDLIEAVYSHDNDPLPMSRDSEATHNFSRYQKMNFY
uniref:Uncharacterized protein n=1 Tax=Panagrolaimus davidi TaxID=227884 RepID=A0A914QVK1_9BILA